jgi:Tfp pilus assembly protein PilX
MSVIHKNNRQRGDALLLSLFMLLLMTLGLLATLRVVKNDASTSGSLSWHTRGKQASEVILKTSISDIANVGAQLTTTNLSWFRTGTDIPTGTYWDTCTSTNTDLTKRCDKKIKNGFFVYRTVQETSTPGASCKYYRIFLHAVETSLVGSRVDSEAIYRLC